MEGGWEAGSGWDDLCYVNFLFRMATSWLDTVQKTQTVKTERTLMRHDKTVCENSPKGVFSKPETNPIYTRTCLFVFFVFVFF